MRLEHEQMQQYLQASEVVDFTHPDVARLAAALRADTPLETARRCFEWVRDQVGHTIDVGRDELSCSASEALSLGTGLCISKSHLAVALLRANGIAAGFCYQRLLMGSTAPVFCTHSLIALFLAPGGWYRCDVRGNKTGVACTFTPGHESLPFTAKLPGERLYAQVWSQPWPALVRRMRLLPSLGAYLAAPIDAVPPEGNDGITVL